MEARIARGLSGLDGQALRRALRRACLERGVDYDLGPGRRVPIDVWPEPRLLRASQLRFLHRLSERINVYLRRMPALYLAHPEVHEIVPLGPAEHEFLVDCWRDEHDGRQTIVGRNDVDMPDDPSKTVAFEANGCSIGGIYYAAACARAVDDVVFRAGALAALSRRLELLDDGCDLVADLLRAHAGLVGAPTQPAVGVLENREWDAGITEMPRLVAHLTAAGLPAVLGDPRELTVSHGRFRLGGRSVDLLYRNMELADFVELEADGADLSALRRAFRENRVVSGLAGDFDHKSLWEVLTSARTRHLVAPADRRVFRKLLLWTRRLRDVRTEGPDGDVVDLVPFTRRNRRCLVIKPNTACGGEGVTLGLLLTDRAWTRAVDRALADPAGWVVQRFWRGTRCRLSGRSLFVTYGVISAPRAVCVLSRACVHPVVNVSQGGGLVAVFKVV
jgi:hypothetical protein